MANVTDNEERYLRQILLLGKGGCLVLRALVNREKNKDGRSLEDILKSLKTKLQKDLLKFQFNYIFPSATVVNANIETWDISLLISIILNVFGHVPQDEKDALNKIREIRNEIQGHHSSYSLTEGEYTDLRLELNENLLKLASDKSTKIEFDKISSHSGAGQLTNGIVLNELNALHAFERDQLSYWNERFGESKSKLEYFCEAVNDVKNESKEHRQMTRDMKIVQSHMHDDILEMKLLTQEKLDSVTEILTKLVQQQRGQQIQHDVDANIDINSERFENATEAQKIIITSINDILKKIRPDVMENPDNSEAIMQNVNELLLREEGRDYELTKALLELIKDIIQYGHIQQARKGSIKLTVRFTSYSKLFSFLQYLSSEKFQDRLNAICRALENSTGNVVTLSGYIAKESLSELHKHLKEEYKKLRFTKSVVLPVQCKDIMDLNHIWKLLQRGGADIHMKRLSEILTKIVGGNVTLTTSVNLKQLEQALLETADIESEHSSSEYLCDNAKRIKVPEHDSSSRADANQRLSTTGQTVLESSKEIKKAVLETDMQQKEDITFPMMTVWREEAAYSYYLRFISMFIDLGSEVILKVFIHHAPGKDAESFLLLNTSRLQQLKHDKILSKQESDLCLTSAPNLKEFDVSLLITLSINLFSEQQLQPPEKGWFYPPRNSDKSISADLLRLRTIKNCIISHDAQLPKWRFEDEWENVQEMFLRIYRVIAPDEESQLKCRIEDYRYRALDPSIENKYNSKLHEWQQQILEKQQQVEDAFKTVEDIDKYLKSKSDRYERYIKLLVKGGRFVILALVEDNIKAQRKSLRDILKEKEDNVRNIIDNLDHLHILYPPGQGNSSDPIDMSTWDITLLVSVLLKVLDSSSLDDEVKQAIINIETARKSYAEAAVVSLDSDAFAEYFSSLKNSIQFLSRYLESQKKIECEVILSECTCISKSSDAHQTYFDELKSQSIKIKSIQDIYKDKIEQTKAVLQEMVTHGIDFKKEQLLELKMNTLGSEEEKKQSGENLLTEIWRKALERSGDSTDFNFVRNEVARILTEIGKFSDVKIVHVKQECILLGITCTSPGTFLGLLNYFESTGFSQSLESISSELGFLFNTVFTIYGNVTLDSLEEIHTDKEYKHVKDRWISIPITKASTEAVMRLRSLFQSKAIMNSTNTIAVRLSRNLKEKVTLKISNGMGYIHGVFNDLEPYHSSSESFSRVAEHTKVFENDSSSMTADQKSLESSEEINEAVLQYYRWIYNRKKVQLDFILKKITADLQELTRTSSC